MLVTAFFDNKAVGHCTHLSKSISYKIEIFWFNPIIRLPKTSICYVAIYTKKKKKNTTKKKSSKTWTIALESEFEVSRIFLF